MRLSKYYDILSWYTERCTEILGVVSIKKAWFILLCYPKREKDLKSLVKIKNTEREKKDEKEDKSVFKRLLLRNLAV